MSSWPFCVKTAAMDGGSPRTLLSEEEIRSLELSDLIGEGSGGKVYKAQTAAGDFVAVKAVATVDPTEVKAIEKEIAMLRECHCPQIVYFRGSAFKQADQEPEQTEVPQLLLVAMDWSRKAAAGCAELLANEKAALVAEFEKSSKRLAGGTARQRRA